MSFQISVEDKIIEVSNEVNKVNKTLESVIIYKGSNIAYMPCELKYEAVKVVIDLSIKYLTLDKDQFSEYIAELSICGDNLLYAYKAANYLDNDVAMDMLAQKIIDQLIANKTVDEIRVNLHIENDFTPDELDNCVKENAWAEM